jgi:hypothetical protein
MRTARKLNIETVAVFSDADSNSQHTKFADQAFRIGEPAPTKSYLCGDRVIDVALKAGVQVCHLNYILYIQFLRPFIQDTAFLARMQNLRRNVSKTESFLLVLRRMLLEKWV